MHTMEIETQETQNGISEIASPDHNAKIPAKNTDTSAAAFQHLQKGQQNAKDSGEFETDTPTYEKPKPVIKPNLNLSQHIRFNLIRHRGTICDIPIEKLFKSFTTTLCNADSSLVILPFQAAKQHYSSLTNIQQIQNIDSTCLNQFFKPYYQKQQY